MLSARPQKSAAGTFVDLGLLALSALLSPSPSPASFPTTAGSRWASSAWRRCLRRCAAPAGPPRPFYGIFFGYLSYAIFNFWLGKFHPLTLFVVPPIYAAYFLVTVPALKLADRAVSAPRVPPAGRPLGLLRVLPEEQRLSRLFLRKHGLFAVSVLPAHPDRRHHRGLGRLLSRRLAFRPAGQCLRRGLPCCVEDWRRYIAPAAALRHVLPRSIVYGLQAQVDTSADRA